MNKNETGLPIEQFIQALTTQLDRAQTAMALKARNMNLPLTFAVRDLSIDLRTHVDVVKSEVRIRPAGPGEQDASTIRLSLTTITRPMIQENSRVPELDEQYDPEDQTLQEAVGDELSEEERRKLEWVGIQRVSQLRNLQRGGSDRTIERVASLPVERLRKALERSSQPMVSHVEPIEAVNGDPPLVRLRGKNLMRGRLPRVSAAGEPVHVIEASDHELLLAPLAHQLGGLVTVETEAGKSSEVALGAPAPANGHVSEPKGGES